MKLPNEDELKIEEWKNAENVNYRKVGNDVELNIYCTDTLNFQNWQAVHLGILPKGYRPDKEIMSVFFARNGTTNKEYICRCRILTTGEVMAIISTDTLVQVNVLAGFIKFNVL